MVTITQPFEATLEVKRSKFIAHLVPFSSFEEKLQQLQKEHPKARHFVTAFRYLNEYEQVVEGCSDDGEPRGTSGKPSLSVLQGKELINVGVIVVRYFGGIKLGTGGLVRAYGDSVNLVCDSATFVPYQKLEQKVLKVSYNDLRQVEYDIEKLGITIIQKEFLDQVVLKLQAPKEVLEKL